MFQFLTELCCARVGSPNTTEAETQQHAGRAGPRWDGTVRQHHNTSLHY